jgi:hypothetical protein
MSTYQTEAQIDDVVRGFESCITGKSEFKHQHHLTVAVSYLRELTLEHAIDKMREAFSVLSTITRLIDGSTTKRSLSSGFKLVAQAMSTMPPDTRVVKQCNRVIELFGNADLALDYYSRDLLFSERAREEFVEPDLKDWREA